MGTVGIFLCIVFGCFISAQSLMNEQDARFPHHFPHFFENLIPFPFKRSFDFPPYDTIFTSWRTRGPDFHMLSQLPPIMDVPNVEVLCDESKLTVLVGKTFDSVVLTGEDLQLGHGCYSNTELPHQFVFTYSLEECGTTRVIHNGIEMFTNTLYMNPKTTPRTWWQTPSTVHISCIPRRSYAHPNVFVSTVPPEDAMMANIKAMNPSWTDTEESNVYKRGQLINLQVSARTRPGQQLFIQSCYVSVSPEPQTRPRQAIIMNKGCSVPVGSPPAAVQFVAPDKDVVNFVLNTSSLIPELFIHCSVIRSDQGVSPGSKSCNYNAIQMRWEELSGTMEECECCSSKCKGPSIKHLPEEAKAIVTTGPLVIVDHDIETRSEPLVFHSSKDPITDSMQSDGAAIEDTIDSGSPISRGEFPSPPQGVVVESRDPFTRLTLWLPGQGQGTERQEDGSDSDDNLGVKLDVSDAVFNFLPGVQHSIGSQESRLDPDTNQIRADTLNVPTLTDWTVLSDPEKAPIIRDSHINKIFLARFGQLGKDAPQEADISVPAEMTLNVLNQDGFSQLKEELAATHRLGTNDAGPLIRSKLEFSKGSDGSQTLSYEEEVEREWEGEKGMSRCGARREPELRRKGLRSAFLDLLRRMDRAE